MEIIKITQNRERYLPLLLLADEQYEMLLKYLHRGDMYAMCEGGAAVAVYTCTAATCTPCVKAAPRSRCA